MELAYIIGGFFKNSTSITVLANYANGTTILVYSGNDLLGTGTLTNSYATITVPSLYVGQPIEAFVTTKGNATGGAILVVESLEQLTGFQNPETVVVDGSTLSYASFVSLYGDLIASIYNPSTNINRVPEIDVIKDVVPFKVNFDLEILQSYGSTQVTVRNVTGSVGSYVYKFDSDASGNTAYKNYTVAGTYKVRVTDSNNSANYLERTYTIAIQPASPPAITSIWGVGYTMTYNTPSNGNVVTFSCHSSAGAVEFKIDGIDGYVGTTLRNGDEYYCSIGNVPSGTYTYKVRLAGTPTTEITNNKLVVL